MSRDLRKLFPRGSKAFFEANPEPSAPLASASPAPVSGKTGTEIPQKAIEERRSRAEIEFEAILKRENPGLKILYERYTLKLAGNVRYKPDFCVVQSDGRLWFYEVKGRYLFKGATKSMTRATLVKPQCAAEIFPHHRFFVAQKVEGGEWLRKEYLPA